MSHMATILVVNRYQCTHLEPFTIRQEQANLLGKYVVHDWDSETRRLHVGSLMCPDCCEKMNFVLTTKKEYIAFDISSSLSILPPKLDLMTWYIRMLNDCEHLEAEQAQRIHGLWSGAVVRLFEPAEIERFFREVCGSRTMPQKAMLSRALVIALAVREKYERAFFWDNINAAFKLSTIYPNPERLSSDSRCSVIIQNMVDELQAQSRLMRLLSLDYPVEIIIPDIVKQAKQNMVRLDDFTEDVGNALRVVIDCLKALTLETSDLSQLKTVTDMISSGKFLITALYQLYARKRALMFQVTDENLWEWDLSGK